MAIYTLFSDITNGTASTDVATYDIGFRFRVTSSVAFKSEWSSSYYLTEVHIYRPQLYTGSYTASLWYSASTGTPIATCYSITGSNREWNSWSFDTPISLSLDTEYRIAFRTYGRGWAAVNNRLVPYYTTTSWWNPINNIERGGVFGDGATRFNPLICPATGGCYHSTGSSTPARIAPPSFPSTQSTTWFGMDISVSGSDINYFVDKRTGGVPKNSERGVSTFTSIAFANGISDLCGGVDRHYVGGITQSLTEGYVSPPSLQLTYPKTMWRFRWGVTSGTRKISVKSKQSGSIDGYTPSLVVRKNESIGVMTSVSASATSSLGWTTIGPITITPTSAGSVWVELWNNNTRDFESPAYFDRIQTS